MKKFCYVILAIAYAVMFIGFVGAYNAANGADVSANGVIAEARVINLPVDQAKWYVSVVGDTKNARYQEILGWFSTNKNLVTLKNQVHYCPVKSSDSIYGARYAKNVKSLPTVRVQTSDGTVVYEAAGRSIPMSAEGLNGAIANSIRPILPWRRNHVHPKPCPNPGPDIDINVDPDPQPLDDEGAPAPDGTNGPATALAIALSILLGAGVGGAKQWKKTYKV